MMGESRDVIVGTIINRPPFLLERDQPFFCNVMSFRYATRLKLCLLLINRGDSLILGKAFFSQNYARSLFLSLFRDGKLRSYLKATMSPALNKYFENLFFVICANQSRFFFYLIWHNIEADDILAFPFSIHLKNYRYEKNFSQLYIIKLKSD